MPYGKGTFTDAHGFELCIKDAVIQYIESNTGNGSGRAGTSPYTAVFIEKSLTVRKRYFRAVNSDDLPSPYTHETRMEIQGIPAAKEVKYTFEAFFENRMVNAGACLAESLLGTFHSIRDGSPRQVPQFGKEFIKRCRDGFLGIS
jgi:predicted SnoaL-like aldol condensation-catalyzing enzyme